MVGQPLSNATVTGLMLSVTVCDLRCFQTCISVHMHVEVEYMVAGNVG